MIVMEIIQLEKDRTPVHRLDAARAIGQAHCKRAVAKEYFQYAGRGVIMAFIAMIQIKSSK